MDNVIPLLSLGYSEEYLAIKMKKYQMTFR